MKLAVAWMALLLQVATPAPTASIEGVVTRAGSDEPLVDAQVALGGTGANAPVTARVTTDRSGRFIIKDLNAGSYTLTVRSPGYAKQQYGQRMANAPGAPIVLTPGQSLKDLAIRLTPAGNIAGHIRNARGRPVPGIPVDLVQRSYASDGRKIIEYVATVRTDDRGEYRFYWITPGRYYVVAGFPYGSGGGEGRNQNAVVRDYLYSFYPGTTEFEKAVAIDVRPGGEADGMDFALTPAKEFRIRARVIDSLTGQPPPKAVAGISYWSPGGGGATTGGPLYRPQTGVVEYPNLTPGSYGISIAASDGARFFPFVRGVPESSAGLTVQVSNEDIDLGVLTLEPPSIIAGRITGDSHPLDAVSRNALRLELLTSSVGFSLMEPYTPQARAFLESDGSFTSNFPYSSLRVKVAGLAPGFYVREARLNGVDALNDFARVPRSGQLEIVLGSKAGQIDGVVRDENSKTGAGVLVVLVPDAMRAYSERFKQTFSDQDGRFSLASIPPGDYKIFAWDSLEPYSYFDPEVLQKYEPKGQPVRIVESSRETLDLRMIP
jgi:hypothetical protein